MAGKIHDRYVVIGFLAVGFVGSMLIGKTLESVRAKAEAEALKELKNKRVPDKVELSSQKEINLETLNALLASAVPEVQWATEKIVRERMYMNESAWRILRADVAGRNDIGRRDKSLIIVAFLLGYDASGGLMIPDTSDPFHATMLKPIVGCLRKMLPTITQTESRGEYHSTEVVRAMFILRCLVYVMDLKSLLKAGVVTHFLSDFPFNARSPNRPLSAIIRELVTQEDGETEFQRYLGQIMYALAGTDAGLHALMSAGLGDDLPGGPGTNANMNGRDAAAHGLVRNNTPTTEASFPDITMMNVGQGPIDLGYNPLPYERLSNADGDPRDTNADEYRLPYQNYPDGLNGFSDANQYLRAPGYIVPMPFGGFPPDSGILPAQINGDASYGYVPGEGPIFEQQLITRAQQDTESAEDRRRRREAMVYAEGDHPVTQTNIFQGQRRQSPHLPENFLEAERRRQVERTRLASEALAAEQRLEALNRQREEEEEREMAPLWEIQRQGLLRREAEMRAPRNEEASGDRNAGQ